MKTLSSVAEVVEALGGNRAISDLTKRSTPEAASMWILRGRFPANTFDVIRSALKRRGYTAPKRIWRMQ